MRFLKKFEFVMQSWAEISRTTRNYLLKIGTLQCVLIPLEILSLFLFAFIASTVINISVQSEQKWEETTERLRTLPDFIKNLEIQSQIAIIFFIALLVFLIKSYLSALLLRKMYSRLGSEHESIMKLQIPNLINNPNQFEDSSQEEISYHLIYGSQAIIFGVVGNSIMLAIDFLALVFVVCFLIILSPLIGIVTLLFYGIVALVLVNKLGRESRRISRKTSIAVIMLQERIRELLGLRREIILSKNNYLYGELSDNPTYEYARTNSQLQLLPIRTKFIMENSLIVASTIVAGVTLLFQDIQTSVQSAALFLVASTRIVPNLIKIQNSVIGLKRSQGLSSGLVKLLRDIRNSDSNRLLWNIVLKPSNETKIVVKDLHFSFNSSHTPLIEKLSYEFREGNIYLIKGKSGAGKSTFLDLLMGFCLPLRGSIEYYGRESSTPFISYVPQFPKILSASLYENITMEPNNADLTNYKSILKKLRLEHISNRYKILGEGLDSETYESQLGSLSGGEIQRISVARALYQNSEVLVLDEPTSAVEKSDALALLKVLNTLKANKIIILVSHEDFLSPFVDFTLEF